MERIKQALVAAREQREAEAAEVAAVDAAKPPAMPQAKPASPSDDSELQVSYSQTRLVDIDRQKAKHNRVIFGDSNTEAENSYKMLRTQVLQRMLANNWNALAITSPGPGQGKTLTAVNLAISLAREVNYTVLLVDLDMQSPSVHSYFGFEPQVGLTQCLFDGVPLSDALFNPGIERLVVLPTQKSPVRSSEILSSKRMQVMVEDLKNRYPSRFVIFDLPPVLSTDDAIAFSPYVDALLLVVAENETTKRELECARDLLATYTILGTVLNKSKHALSVYPYGT